MEDKPIPIPKILIVDDEERNIKLLKAMLSTERYELLGAGNGEEALRITAENPVDLILLDVMMPGISGFEVCRRLKKEAKTKIIPVVMVTALRETEHRVQAMEAHGGKIWVESQGEGKGSTFRFCLPLERRSCDTLSVHSC